ncbi:MAG: transketolase C-terminal domain-containing protein [Patescibacteria group bacterium]
MDNNNNSKLELVAHETRRRVFSTILNAGSGHLGGCSSSLELMVSLYFGGILRYDPANPRHPDRDRVLVRGHLGPLRYSIFSLLGWIEEDELLTYRNYGSRLQGHEAMELVPGVDITPSGSLGMLMSYGVGAAIALKNFQSPARVWVMLGDGEEQEGNVSEAARHATHAKLDNLICVIDRNSKQLSQPTSVVDSASDIATIWNGYGWSVEEIGNANSIDAVLQRLTQIQAGKGPQMVIANTTKGLGIAGAEEHFCGYHTISSCTPELVAEAIKHQERQIETRLTRSGVSIAETVKSLVDKVPRPKARPSIATKELATHRKFNFRPAGNEKSVVDAFVTYLQQLTAVAQKLHPLSLYVMTADLIQLNHVELCGLRKAGVQYMDVGLREQHMLALAHGLSVTDRDSRIIINGGDAFLYRGSDQLHSAAQAGSSMILVSDFSGLSGSRNGATHQSTGQSGAILTMPGVTFLEPADVQDFYNCLNWSLTAHPPGPVYIRIHNIPVPALLPAPGVERNLSYYLTHLPPERPEVILVGSGLSSFGVTEAAKLLEQRGISVRAIHIINPKTLDADFVNLLEDGVPTLTVYNGNPSVLQYAVSKAVMENMGSRPSVIVGHGFQKGSSGKFDDLRARLKLDGTGIAETAYQLITDG